MKQDSKAAVISNLVNNTLFNPMRVGVELSNDHRYLVNEEFKMFLHFVGQLSRNYDKGNYDDRNAYACKCAKIIVDALENAQLYDRKFYANEYDKIIEKYFE